VYSKYLKNYSSLDPESGINYSEVSTGYILPTGRIGAATSVQTANQLAEVEARLKEGAKTIEVQPIQPETFEAIPEDHFKEINRLAKISGAEITLHAPIIDPSGFTDRGWSENARAEAERHLLKAVRKGHVMNPDGNVPITIHSSSIPAAEWNSKLKPSEWETERKIKPKDMLVVVNRQSGEITGMKREKMYVPGKEKPEIMAPESRLETTNATEWERNLKEISDYKKEIEDSEEKIYLAKEKAKREKRGLYPHEQVLIERLKHRIGTYSPELRKRMNSLYSNAIEFGNEDTKRILKPLREEWKEGAKEMRKHPKEAGKIDHILHEKLYYGLQATRDTPPEIFQPVEKLRSFPNYLC